MAVNLSPYGGVGAQFLDNSGNVLTGGKIYTYAAGTTTNQVTYTNATGAVAHSNPIVLDASGRVPSGEIWLTDGLSYKFVLKDSNDVLIATYDNIVGINSNFIAFTNQQEIQTATSGQTVFDLTTMTYQPGTNNLTVFVDGVNQYGPGAQYAYLETDSDTVTFVNGLHVGAEVKFTTSQLNSSGLQANAFQVSYTPPFTGSVGTNVGDKLAQTISVKDFGAVGDGVADDTAAIQAALDAASGSNVLYIPAGVYRCKNLYVKSNTTLIFDPSAKLKALNGIGLTDCVLILQAVSNITIHGNHATVEMIKSEYISGEQRHGVLMLSVSDVSIYDLHSIDSGGDGFYIGSDYSSVVPSYRVSLINCYSDNNRRQGLSITGVVDCWVIGGVYSGSTGTAPSAGIDVEPNSNDTIQNVNLINVVTRDNDGAGIIVVPLGAGDSVGSLFNVNIMGCSSFDDAKTSDGSYRFDNGRVPTNEINGRILMRDCFSMNSGLQGLNIGSITWQDCPELIIDNLKIINPAQNATPSTTSACGVTMFTSSGSGDIENVKLTNVVPEDRRSIKKMYYPFFISGSGSYTAKNVTMIDCDGFGYTASDGPFGFVGPVTDFSITQTNPRTVTFAAGATADRYAGLMLTQTASGVITLPSTSARLGLEYLIYNSTGSTLEISPNAADFINWYGLVTGERVILRSAGSYMRLKANTAGKWDVMTATGVSAPQGFNNPGKVVYQTAAPTTRAWAVNDRVINSSPTVGQPKSWVCTVAGTPGTWVSEGNL